MDNLNIIKTTDRDTDKLIKLARVTYLQHYQYLWIDNGSHYMNKHFNKSSIINWLSDINSETFIVYFDHFLMGYYKLNYNLHLDKTYSPNAAELERIYFLKEFTGKSIGQKVLRYIEKQLINKDLYQLWLKTMTKGKAYSFYEKNGFKAYGNDILNEPLIYNELQDMTLFFKLITP